jgi:UDP:flavonoid glycosyltransferase YjiC (YdhE family)
LPDQVTPAAVREAVWTVLRDDSSERAAARSLASEIAAMPSAVEVAGALMSIADRPGAAA